MGCVFMNLVQRIQVAMQYEDRDTIHARLMSEGVSETDFFFAWSGAILILATDGAEAAA